MFTTEAVRWAGSARKLAKILQVTPATITQWGNHPPILRQYQLHVVSGGELLLQERLRRHAQAIQVYRKTPVVLRGPVPQRPLLYG